MAAAALSLCSDEAQIHHRQHWGALMEVGLLRDAGDGRPGDEMDWKNAGHPRVPLSHPGSTLALLSWNIRRDVSRGSRCRKHESKDWQIHLS
jgi:hypothetical protein